MITKAWPRANRAMVTKNLTVIIEAMLIERFLYSIFLSWLAGLEKIHISQGLITQLHICRVIQTPQSVTSPETPRQVPVSPGAEHRCSRIEDGYCCI